MKLRLFHKTAIVILFGLSALGLVNNLPNFAHKPLSFALVASYMVLHLSWLIGQYITLYEEIRDCEVLSDSGEKYPFRKIRVYDNVKKDYIALLIAGVLSEVDEDSSPEFYGMPSHIDYILNQEDLILNKESKVIEIVNAIYKTNYTAV